MRSPRAGLVSLGGRRKSTGPPGSDIIRKKTDCSALVASMLRIHAGSSPKAAIVEPRATTNTTSARRLPREELGKYFNLHLLGSDIVGDVLRRNGQCVAAGDCFSGDDQRASVRGGFRIPPEFDRRRTFQSR